MGERFRERNRLAKWLLGAVGAVFAATLVVYLIESHRLPPAGEKVAPKPKPVTVTIVPARRP